ncbi:uncharacterized protein BDV14DRAFT_180581 [Aspergillus stella-maris]|uniref:uncharacterized protein n=1 Tax=Aspergillus stella-maris TaxID=1810926 RepID=UPI003CCCEBD4
MAHRLNSGVESNLIIIAASFPALRQLYRMALSRLEFHGFLSAETTSWRWQAGAWLARG